MKIGPTSTAAEERYHRTALVLMLIRYAVGENVLSVSPSATRFGSMSLSQAGESDAATWSEAPSGLATTVA